MMKYNKEKAKNLLKKDCYVLILGIIASITILLIVLNKMCITKFVYYWDYVGYYENCIEIIEDFKVSIFYGIVKIIYTVFYEDYNYLGAILPSIIMAIFGKNRIIYTIGTTISYLIPFIFFYLYSTNKILKDIKYKTIYMIAALLSCFPLLTYLNYMGFIDIGGLSIIILILIIASKNSFKTKDNIFIGLLLIILYFFRRWYMFYIISFIITLFLINVFDVINTKESKKKLLIKYIKKYLTIGITIAFVIVLTLILDIILFRRYEAIENFYLYKLLFVNYGKLYKAYKTPLLNEVIAFGQNFGYSIILLVLISLVIVIKNKKYIKQVIFLFCQGLLCFVLFEITQSHSIHHFLLYVPNIMFIIIYALLSSKQKTTKVLVMSMVLLNIIFSIPIFYNFSAVRFLRKNGIFNNIDLNALVREDFDEFVSINDELKNLSENGNKKIYLNASSNIINSSMFASYDRTIGSDYSYKGYLLYIAQVDSRDGLPRSLIDADIVIVTTPDQIHMVPENQKIISYVNKVFLDEEYSNLIVKKFEKIKTLNISGIKLHVFKKREQIRNEEYDEFLKKAIEFKK